MNLSEIRSVFGVDREQMANLIGIKLQEYVQYEARPGSMPDFVAVRIRRKFDLEAIAYLATRVRI